MKCENGSQKMLDVSSGFWFEYADFSLETLIWRKLWRTIFSNQINTLHNHIDTEIDSNIVATYFFIINEMNISQGARKCIISYNVFEWKHRRTNLNVEKAIFLSSQHCDWDIWCAHNDTSLLTKRKYKDDFCLCVCVSLSCPLIDFVLVSASIRILFSFWLGCDAHTLPVSWTESSHFYRYHWNFI